MKVAILDDYQDVVRGLDCFKTLSGHEVVILNHTCDSEAELAQALDGVEALVLIRERTVITESLLQKLPALKLISQTGKVSNHIDVALCHRYGVQVAEGVGSPVAPAELCWALIMAASRHIPDYIHQLRQGWWQHTERGLGRTLNGLTLGIWGYGKIGQRITKYADVFGMKVMVWGSDFSRELAKSHGHIVADSKDTFFRQADIVSLHLRLHPATRGCVTLADLDKMKPDSLFVNISRAELVETGALYTTMRKTRSKLAAIDVYEQEPACVTTEPLLGLSNVLCSPHLGYVEKNSYELYFSAAFDNVIAFAEDRPQNLAQ